MFLTKSLPRACMRSMFSSHETCPHINKGVAILQWVPCNVKTFEVSPDAMQKTTCLEGSPRCSRDFQRSPGKQTLKYFLLKLLYCFLTSLDLKYIWKGFCSKFWLHYVKNAQKTSSSLTSITPYQTERLDSQNVNIHKLHSSNKITQPTSTASLWKPMLFPLARGVLFSILVLVFGVSFILVISIFFFQGQDLCSPVRIITISFPWLNFVDDRRFVAGVDFKPMKRKDTKVEFYIFFCITYDL